MELHGSLIVNLEAAVRSAQRLRGQPLYPETLKFWSELLEMARRIMGTMIDSDTPRIASLADQLDIEIKAFCDN
jgi:hypothetical protein